MLRTGWSREALIRTLEHEIATIKAQPFSAEHDEARRAHIAEREAQLVIKRRDLEIMNEQLAQGQQMSFNLGESDEKRND